MWRIRRLKYWFKYNNPWMKLKNHIKYGSFDEREAWNFYGYAAMFMLPRLKHLKANSTGYPTVFNDEKEWNVILGKIIEALEITLDEDRPFAGEESKVLDAKVKEGLDLLAKYWYSLWD